MESLEQLTQNIQILLEHYKMLQKENDILHEDLNTLRQEIIRSHGEIEQLQKRCRMLTAANAIAGDPATRKDAYKRLTHIIEQIDKAIDTMATE